ncbi:MAG: hypothetical protein ACP5QK_09660 [Myxococcota bacterium]
MKRLITIIVMFGLIGCGTYDEDSNYVSTSGNLLSIKQKVDKKNKISFANISQLIKKVEVSISDNDSALFTESATDEFLINSVIDIYIGAKFYNYTNKHKLGINIYLPDGNIYRKSEAEVDFSVQGNYSIGGVIIENTDSILIARYIIPVAGTELSIFNLTGTYNVEILLDNSVVAKSSFVLK